MSSPHPASTSVVWLSVVPAALAALILFDAVFAVGAALDWAVLGLYDVPQVVILIVGLLIATFSFALALRFFTQAYRADLELK